MGQTKTRGMLNRMASLIAAIICLGSTTPAACGAEVKIAVAANFTEPARELAAIFEKSTGHKLLLSFGATGQFYAQIVQGAPFDVLLAADTATPNKAEREGHAVAGTTLTYAVGRLVLYSKTIPMSDGEAILKQGHFAKLAIANPATAPYGAAAIETLRALAVDDALRPKIVQGNNIAQTLQFIETGNAELGFVSLSQVAHNNTGAHWLVPARLHDPIAQAAVLLKPSAGSDAARAFLTFLKSPEARAVIEKFGYGSEQ